MNIYKAPTMCQACDRKQESKDKKNPKHSPAFGCVTVPERVSDVHLNAELLSVVSALMKVRGGVIQISLEGSVRSWKCEPRLERRIGICRLSGMHVEISRRWQDL